MRTRLPRRRPLLALTGMLVSILLAGCGIAGEPQRTVPPPAVTPYQVISPGRPTGPPASHEDIRTAARRIGAAIVTGDCGLIGPLYTFDSPSRESAEGCSTLSTLGRSGRVSGFAAYGDETGVIDYVVPGSAVSLIVVRQQDGLFHIAFPIGHRAAATVGTPLGSGIDAIAATAVRALHDQDCDRYLSVANPTAGIGSLPRSEACQALENDPVPAALFDAPGARPRLLGGNALVAFYALDTPSSYLTLVLARDNQASENPGGPYGYVTSVISNSASTPAPSA